MPSAWRPLQLESKRSDVPSLLIRSEFGWSNYRVWLTDLTYVWSESLDRKQIIQRAFSIDTSIDPSEDTSQLRLFLQSVENALTQRTATSIDIVHSDNDKQIKLRTSTPLPGDLQPLEWYIQFVPASQDVLTDEFVIPLLSQQSAAKVEKSSLMQQIRHRDHVIGRLVEKMQSDGVDMSRIFPGAVSSKVGTGSTARQAIGKSVKGLAEFDVGEWQSHLAKDNAVPGNLKDLLESVLSTDHAETSEGVQAIDVGHIDNWWKNLRHENLLPKPATVGLANADTEEDPAVNGEFQTQATPPKLKTKPESASVATEAELRGSSPLPRQDHTASGSTTEESDDDLQSSKPRAFSPVVHDRSSSGRSSNGRASLSPPGSRLKARSNGNGALAGGYSLPKAVIASKDHNTASSSEEDAMDLDKKPPQPALKPTSKLGKIGGKALKPAAEDVMRDPTPPISKPKAKLGKIGGFGKIGRIRGSQTQDSRLVAASSGESSLTSRQNLKREDERLPTPDAAKSEKLARVKIPPQTSSPPQETHDQKANKKRERLKRELESKSQVGAKKKRKF